MTQSWQLGKNNDTFLEGNKRVENGIVFPSNFSFLKRDGVMVNAFKNFSK